MQPVNFRSEEKMSILRIAVNEHLRRERMTIRELLEAAYFRRYEKPAPQKAIDTDVSKWEAGQNDIPYLYDLILNPGRG